MRKNDTLNKIASWHIHQFITDKNSKILVLIFGHVKNAHPNVKKHNLKIISTMQDKMIIFITT